MNLQNTERREERVDELRQQLRALGYLDAGVDRFVLAPAHAHRRPSILAILASLRIGALAALLLGPAAAVGLAARLPGLITGVRDALVVAAYLGVAFGAAVALAGVAAGLLIWAVSRIAPTVLVGYGRRLSIAAGTLVAVLCLAYLTLWWRTTGDSAGWDSTAWTIGALALAATISVLLGHAVMVMALAVIVSATGSHGSQGVPGGSWRMSVAAGIAAFVSAGALLVATAAREQPEVGAPSLTVVSPGLHVRVIAIDGFDPALFADLARQGAVPALTRAFDRAVARLDSEDGNPPSTDRTPRDPAREWTTIATGQPPRVHGVHQLETRKLAGVQGFMPARRGSPLAETIRAATDLARLTRPAIASRNERLAKTFWEVAAEAGLRTAVINWWATWPAPPDRGIILTDRATLRLERGGTLDGEIAPASLYEQLRSRWPDIRARAEARATEALETSSLDEETAALLRRSAELDAMQLELAAEVDDPRPDLLVTYLPGLDIAGYALFGTDASMAPPSVVASRLEAIRMYYLALDRLIAPAVDVPSGELLVLITGAGRVAAVGDGRMALLGAHAGANAEVDGRTTDVAPTVLYALGLPISRALAGEPLLRLLEPSFASRYPVRHVADYGAPGAMPAARGGQPLDDAMIDRLRSLGYVR